MRYCVETIKCFGVHQRVSLSAEHRRVTSQLANKDSSVMVYGSHTVAIKINSVGVHELWVHHVLYYEEATKTGFLVQIVSNCQTTKWNCPQPNAETHTMLQQSRLWISGVFTFGNYSNHVVAS